MFTRRMFACTSLDKMRRCSPLPSHYAGNGVKPIYMLRVSTRAGNTFNSHLLAAFSRPTASEDINTSSAVTVWSD